MENSRFSSVPKTQNTPPQWKWQPRSRNDQSGEHHQGTIHLQRHAEAPRVNMGGLPRPGAPGQGAVSAHVMEPVQVRRRTKLSPRGWEPAMVPSLSSLRERVASSTRKMDLGLSPACRTGQAFCKKDRALCLNIVAGWAVASEGPGDGRTAGSQAESPAAGPPHSRSESPPREGAVRLQPRWEPAPGPALPHTCRP